MVHGAADLTGNHFYHHIIHTGTTIRGPFLFKIFRRLRYLSKLLFTIKTDKIEECRAIHNSVCRCEAN